MNSLFLEKFLGVMWQMLEGNVPNGQVDALHAAWTASTDTHKTEKDCAFVSAGLQQTCLMMESKQLV